jgi:hypothetical protein
LLLSRPGFSSDFLNPSLPLVASSFPRHTLSSQALPRHRQVCSLFPLWLSPRPVTHRHVTRARPTSHCPSTALGLAPRFLYTICPSAQATAPLPALAHARSTPLFPRLGPAPLPDSEAATWARAHNPPHTALPSARPAASARPGDRDRATSARPQHLMLNAPAHGAAASRHAELLLLPALYPRQIPIVVVLR